MSDLGVHSETGQLRQVSVLPAFPGGCFNAALFLIQLLTKRP